MNHKTHFIIYSEVIIENNRYEFFDATIIIEDIPQSLQPPNNAQLKLITVVLPGVERNINDAYTESLEITKKYLNRISLLGYCKTTIVQHILTTLTECQENEDFQVLTTHITHRRDYKYPILKLDFDQLKSSSIHEYLERSLSFLNKALSSESLEEKILMLYSSLECIAEEECIQYKEFTCKNCGNKVNANLKLIRGFIKDLLNQYGVANIDICNFLDRDRNKIAHGGGRRNLEFYTNLKESILKIQHIIVEILAAKLNVTLVNSTTSIIDLPLALYVYKKVNGNYVQSGNSSHSMRAGVSIVGNTTQNARKNITLFYGIDGSNPDPILSPDIQVEFFPKESTHI